MTAINFIDDLSSKYARRRFFALFLLMPVLCAFVAYLIGQSDPEDFLREFSGSLLVEISAGSFIVLFVYALYVYFIGTEPPELSVIRSRNIGRKMKEMPIETSVYLFWGRSGGFFRDYPLMELNERATLEKRNIRIEVLIPDPSDPRLVSSYTGILRSLREPASGNPLLPQVLATCLACAILDSNNRFLQVSVHLSRYLPGFRLDLSDRAGILTQDDKKKSALYFESNSEFYNMFRATMVNERDVSSEVKWKPEVFSGLTLEDDNCSIESLREFGIEVPISEYIVDEVARLIRERPHRYK